MPGLYACGENVLFFECIVSMEISVSGAQRKGTTCIVSEGFECMETAWKWWMGVGWVRKRMNSCTYQETETWSLPRPQEVKGLRPVSRRFQTISQTQRPLG